MTTTLPDLLVPTRTILHHKLERAEDVDLGQCWSLEGIRDYNRKREQLSDPQDIVAKPSEVVVTFGADGAHARFLTPRGPTAPMRLLKSAYQQMAREALPAYGGGFLMKSAALDERALPMITALWAMHAKECDRPMTYRTQLTKIDGRVERVVRAMVTPVYAPYNHSELLDAAINAVGNLPVIEALVTDTRMKVVVIDPEGEGFRLGKQVKTLQLEGSETGHRHSTVKGGLFAWLCTNGMRTGRDETETRWRHVGDPQRVRREMPDAIEGAMVGASDVLLTYQRAVEIFIDDAAAFAEQELRRQKASHKVIAQALVGMKDPTSCEYGTLAGVVDGVTLIAQQQNHDEQEFLEGCAATILRRGVRRAQDNRIKVEVAP